MSSRLRFSDEPEIKHAKNRPDVDRPGIDRAGYSLVATEGISRYFWLFLSVLLEVKEYAT